MSAWRMPSPRIPGSPREAPSTVQTCSIGVAAAALGRLTAARGQPALAALEREHRAEVRARLDAGQAGRAHAVDRLQAQLDLAAAGARAAAQQVAVARELLRPPAEPRAQPADEQQARDERVLAVAHGDLRERVQLVAARRRVVGGGEALAPRRAAQPREVDDLAALGELAVARQRGLDLGLVDGVEQHDLGERRAAGAAGGQRVDGLGMAVRRPDRRAQVGRRRAGRRSCRGRAGGARRRAR